MPATSNDFPAKLVYQPVLGFIEQLASKAPAPGGGSAAALSGALGSALLTMVIQLTIEKKDYAAVASRLSELRDQLEGWRASLVDGVDRDSAAFSRFRMANKLPERNDAEKAAKAMEVAAATREAIEVPESTMTFCLQALEIAPEIAVKGNVNCISDAGTGAELLLAGLEGGAANVLINLAGVSAEQAGEFRGRVATARQRGRAALEEVRRIVGAKIGG